MFWLLRLFALVHRVELVVLAAFDGNHLFPSWMLTAAKCRKLKSAFVYSSFFFLQVEGCVL